MKKALILILSALMVAAAAGCNDPKESTNTDPTQQAAETEQQTQATADTANANTDKHDYSVLRTFFEQKDEEGNTNGKKCFPNYDPEDTSTWHDGSDGYDNYVRFDADGNVTQLNLKQPDGTTAKLVGKLDLSELASLATVDTWNVIFDEVNATELPIAAKQNNAVMRFPMVQGEAKLSGGFVERVYMLSASHTLCDITGEAETELSELPSFKLDVNVDGEGYAGVSAWSGESCYEVHAVAQPIEGKSFVGWFDAQGNLVSEDADYELFGQNSGNNADGAHASFALTARFE